jgi:tRNA-dihydrouridine synthase
MLGRGLVSDPGMLLSGGTESRALEQFHDALLEEYLVLFGGSRNAMFRLKENWSYLLPRFENSEKLGKQLRKTTDLAEYKSIVSEIFHTLPLK